MREEKDLIANFLSAQDTIKLIEKLVYFSIFCVIGAYLIGSISFSVIFTKILSNNQDIRNIGSKNAGFTNVLRSVGKKPAIFTFIFDFLKGIVSVLLGRIFFSNDADMIVYATYFSGFFCILGHIFPCFFNFRGGKAVLTSAAIILLADYKIFFIVFLVFLITFIISRIVSVSSILAALSYPILTIFIFRGKIFESISSIVITALIVAKHKKNIKRIFKGQEKKISIKKSL